MAIKKVAAAKKEKLPEWNLKDLYPSRDLKEFKADMAKMADLAKKFANKYEGRVEKLSGDELGTAIAEYEKLSTIASRVGTYSYLLYCTHLNDEKIGAFSQNVSDKMNDIFNPIIFFTLAINKISDVQMKQKLKSKKLQKYQPWIRDLAVGKPYQLDDKLEKYIGDSSIAASSWVRLFDETHAALKYDFKGQKLGNAEIFDKMSNRDRKIREAASKAISKTLGDNIRTFTLITNVLAKDKAVDDKWRGYKSVISSRNNANLVEDEVVDALINTVKKNYPRLSHRYFKYKAKQLGLKKMEFWDRNAPLPDSDDRYIPYAEGKKLVLDAYTAFSPEIASVGKQFFDKGWIDAGPREGKESGAFSHPCSVDVHPYILMNYLGKSRDVMTLAHELGHGVHQVLAAEQGTLISDTPLTLAETASVFGEQLTFRHMLSMEKNEKRKKAMIAAKVEDMLNTVVRQVAFCEFERKVHNGRKVGELSSEEIGKLWMQCQKESLGPVFNFREDYKYYWSYIPHFIHSPFYVYAYAFGDCLVNSLYSVYLDGKVKNFEDKYINMLKSGGALRHKELLKPFGLDATKPDFWQKGLNIIDNFITELES